MDALPRLPQGDHASQTEAQARRWVSALPPAQRPDRWAVVPPRELVPQVWVRDRCLENRCGKFGRHPCCPPEVGSLEACGARLATYDHCLLVAKTFWLDARHRQAVRGARHTFQETVLALGAAARRLGTVTETATSETATSEAAAGRGGVPAANLGPPFWALPGGTCALCEPCCPAEDGGACPRPGDAQPSLEALGVDVLGLLGRLGWDTAFHPDRVTWIGALLWRAGGAAVQRTPGTEGRGEGAR